jgi:hypothetical protein
VFLIDSGDGLTGQWRRAHRTALECHTHSTSLGYCFSGFHSTHWCYLHTTNSSDLGRCKPESTSLSSAAGGRTRKSLYGAMSAGRQTRRCCCSCLGTRDVLVFLAMKEEVGLRGRLRAERSRAGVSDSEYEGGARRKGRGVDAWFMSLSFLFLFCLGFKGMYGSYVGEDTSLASLGQEAGNGLYMPWPQSGRKQYEENKKKTKKNPVWNSCAA